MTAVAAVTVAVTTLRVLVAFLNRADLRRHQAKALYLAVR